MKIDYKPYKTLEIYNIHKITMEKFLTDHVDIGNSSNPRWIDGYLLFFYSPNDTTYIQKLEHEEGILIWTWLEYCKMPTYEAVLKNDETNAACKVTDMSGDELYMKIVEYLKKK